MPPIRGIESLPDGGFRINTQHHGVKEFQAVMLPGSENTAAKAEAFVNAWLASQNLGFNVAVHVFSLVPLSLTVCCSNLDAPIQPNWWVT